MQSLFDTQQILLSAFKKRPYHPRKLYETLDTSHRLVGLVGPRGVGKTTYLLHKVLTAQHQNESVLYVSADNIFFLQHTLLELADWLYKETDIRLLYIDEIHKYPNWNQELKNIYDTYLDMRIVFTGSSMIDIVRSKYDLSRRAILYPFYGLSFREYLQFKFNKQISSFSLEELISKHVKIASALNEEKVLKHFRDYLAEGYYPFFTEFKSQVDYFQAVNNIVQKIIYEDIALVYPMKTATLLILEKLFHYTICSSPGELSAYKLANHLQKDYESVSEYLRILNEAGLIRFLHTAKSGKAVLKSPAKIMPDNTVMVFSTTLPTNANDVIGKLRETFLLSQLQNAKYSVLMPDKGDFLTQGYCFEVGGKNKTFEQLKNIENSFVLADGIIIGSGRTIPLYLFGFLY